MPKFYDNAKNAAKNVINEEEQRREPIGDPIGERTRNLTRDPIREQLMEQLIKLKRKHIGKHRREHKREQHETFYECLNLFLLCIKERIKISHFTHDISQINVLIDFAKSLEGLNTMEKIKRCVVLSDFDLIIVSMLLHSKCPMYFSSYLEFIEMVEIEKGYYDDYNEYDHIDEEYDQYDTDNLYIIKGLSKGYKKNHMNKQYHYQR